MKKNHTRKKRKKFTHPNNNLFQSMGILLLCGALCIANIFYVMIFKRHIWSQKEALASSIHSSISHDPLPGRRGAIYDRNHTVLAEETPAYTLIARFDPRTPEEIEEQEQEKARQRQAALDQAKANGNYEQVKARQETEDASAAHLYVEDPKAMAQAIASVIGGLTDAEKIETIITTAMEKGLSQTELGPGTKRLDKTVKETLETMKIPGLEFVEVTKRSYPVSPFASNLLGFAAYNEDSQSIQGVMGLEMELNDVLKGVDGMIRYQHTFLGEPLAGTTQIEKNPQNGRNVQLTLDASLQEVVQEQLDITMSANNASSAWCLVMEVETGKILAWASCPTYNQNQPQEIPSYTDRISQQPYEPGSVMKPFVYAAAMEAGVYPYNSTYRAGEFAYDVAADGTITRLPIGSSSDYPIIRDALGNDYGTLSFEEGLAHSSNIAICELLANHLDQDTFQQYLEAFGFGQLVDTPYVPELAGSVNLNDVPSYLSSGFGQATSVTVLELAQAYTALFNDGVMMKPYVVDSIIDSATGEVVEKFEPEAVGTPISAQTANQVKDILMTVMEPGMSGEKFIMDGVSMAGKTGTGEIFRAEYQSYDPDVFTSSIMAAAPASDPKIMVYWGMESANYINYSAEPFQTIMQAALLADNVSGGHHAAKETSEEKQESFEMPALINHSLEYAQKKLDGHSSSLLILSDGTRIVNQFPPAGTMINPRDKILLSTDGNGLTMPDMTGWTLKDLDAFEKLCGLSIVREGNGKVSWQNIEPETLLETSTQIEVTLE